MAQRSARDKLIAARAKAQAAAQRRVRMWIFGPEMTFPGDPHRPIEMDHTVTADTRIVRYGPGDDGRVFVGRFSGITHSAVMLPGGLHRADFVSAVHAHWRPEGWDFAENALHSKDGGIHIGSDVLVGYEAMVLSGVHIGHGAIVASRAVVVKDVEPYSIVGGNPAKHIKYRFDEDTRAALLRIAWWDWPDDKVMAHRHEIDSPDVAGFVAKHDPGV